MVDARCYQFTSDGFGKAFPRLIEKIYQSQKRCIIRMADAAQMENLNKLLWTYSPLAFLPHGTAHDAHASEQPVLLTTNRDDHANQAVVEVVMQGAAASGRADYTTVIAIVPDHRQLDAEWLAHIQQTVSVPLAQYFQDESGVWQKHLA